MGKYSDLYLKEHQNGVAQRNSVTQRATSQPKSSPVVSTPVNNKQDFATGVSNLTHAIGEGVGNFAQTVAQDPLGFIGDTANSLVVQPAKELATNTFAYEPTQRPWGAMAGGVVKGAVALPQNLWNLGVDAVNAYNDTPKQNQYKAHYVEDIANALQGNKLYQDMYQKPKQANPTIAELSSFAAPMAVAGKISKTADTISKANKVAKESTRIASKLNDAQKAKYANQIKKLANNNIEKGVIPPSRGSQVLGNTATGFGLGALEGNTLQERASNGAAMAGLGLGLTGGHALAQKAWNSKRGLKLRENSAETLKNLTTDYDKVSQAVAGIDNALNTNLSKNASDLTKTRKEYLDKLSENQNYKRHISDEEKALLEDAGKLTDEQQTEIFERNKYGNRERALRISKDVKAELANQGQGKEHKHSTTVKSPEEAAKWWEEEEKRSGDMKRMQDAWEKQQEHAEDDLSHVKSEIDINTPKQEETPVKNNSDMSENIPERTVDKNGRVTVYNPDGTIKVRFKKNIKEANKEQPREILDSERAEGSDSSFWYEKKANGKFGTNKLDKDNALIDDNAEGKRLGMHEDSVVKSDLEPTDTESLRKEIDKWNEKDFKNKSKIQEEHLPDIESNKSQIDGITKRYLKATGVYKIPSDLNPKYSGKIVKANIKLSNGETIKRDTYLPRYKGLASKLRDNKNIVNVRKAIDALTNLEPSVEVRNALTHLYKQAHENVRKYIDGQISKKGLNYTFDSNIELKSKRQLAREQKQVRTFMEDESMKGINDVQGSVPIMKSARKTEVSPNAKVKPYEGDSPAGNTTRDAKTWKSVENEKTSKDITNEEKWLGNPDRPYNDLGLLYDKDTTPVSKAVKDVSKTKFAKADRVYTSHKIKDFADDISNGNSDVANAIKEFVGDEHTFDFDDLPEDSHGRTYTKNDTFTINSKDSVERQLGTASHETHHILFHKIAEACGKDSAEYKIYQEGLDANNAVHEFEKNNPEIKRTKNEIDKLLSKKDTAKKALDLLDKLDDTVYDKLMRYKRLIKKYENTQLEQEANLAKNGEWVFNGKDISYYYDKLKLHRGRTQQSVGENSGNVKRGTGEIPARRQEQGDVSGDSGEGKQHLQDGFLEDKENNKLIHRTLDWFDKTKNKHTKFYHQFLEATPEIKRFTDAYKAIQDKREAFFREFGTYTDERMKARLFKQSRSGEGVYFQQGTKRNEKVVWGEESNTKVGFTGHKELEGVSERGTTQEGLARGFSDVVRMEHTKNCIQFLKDNFSKEQEGYIPVNSKLLANAMYFGKSKAWYETIRKGQEAIDKTFDEKNAKEWNELYKTTEADKSDIYLPKDLLDLSISGEKELPLDYLATYGKVLGTKGRVKGMAKVAGAMLDFYTDRFKRKVLTSASFFANNRFGNQIMLAMTADNPAEYIKGLANAFRLKESEVPTQILESTLAEAIQKEANAGIRKYFSEKNNTLDNIARILDGDEIDSKSITATASNWLISKPNALFRSLSKLTGEINERFERFERKQAYSQALSKMKKDKVLKTAKQFAGIHELAETANKDTLIREAVIDKVADVLGDYNNFNKFEKNFMKKLIPFYAWNRTITRHVINLAKDNPVKATLVAIETYRLLNQDDGLEDYQHGSLKTGWKNKRTNSNVVINKASMIPYNTLFDMVSGENIGSVSPLITKPLEAVRGEKFFKPASEITSKNWKRTTKDKKQGYQNIKTGEFKEGKAPASVRAGYIAKDAMETVYPMAGSPMTKGVPDAIKHYSKTGEFLFPDKQYDANLGGFYDGDKAGKYKRGKKTYDRKLSAKNRLDLKYQLMNRTLGLGIQPEHKVSKEQKEKYKNQRKRMRGN